MNKAIRHFVLSATIVLNASLFSCRSKPVMKISNRSGEARIVVSDHDVLRLPNSQRGNIYFPGGSDVLYIFNDREFWRYPLIYPDPALSRSCWGKQIYVFALDESGDLWVLDPNNEKRLSNQPTGYPLAPDENTTGERGDITH